MAGPAVGSCAAPLAAYLLDSVFEIVAFVSFPEAGATLAFVAVVACADWRFRGRAGTTGFGWGLDAPALRALAEPFDGAIGAIEWYQ